jgi:subtilase family serine protease
VTVTANFGPFGSKTWNAASGAHSLQAWVDDVNRMAETDENNNKLIVPLSVGIDLTVTDIRWAPIGLSAGQPTTFSATVKNVGTVATPPGVIIGVAFAIDGTLVTWSDNTTTSLAPGASVTVTANGGPVGSLVWAAASGSHTLQAWVDDVNRMVDVNRSNNKTFAKVFVP